jgi:peptidoglycan LD-endopeptidase CwlK
MRTWSSTSLKNLQGIHPDLRKVMDRALQESPIDFRVIEGLRTLARQKQLVASGASQTYRSRHLTGHAVDIAPLVSGTIRWDWPLFHRIAPAVKLAAQKEGVPLEWGGDWKTFKDGPHWQLPWATYP